MQFKQGPVSLLYFVLAGFWLYAPSGQQAPARALAVVGCRVVVVEHTAGGLLSCVVVVARHVASE